MSVTNTFIDINKLTLNHDVLAVPEEAFIATKDARVHCRRVFPLLPSSPVLTEVTRVAKHVRSEGLVREGVLAAGRRESAVVVVCIREYHDILRGALPDQ